MTQQRDMGARLACGCVTSPRRSVQKGRELIPQGISILIVIPAWALHIHKTIIRGLHGLV